MGLKYETRRSAQESWDLVVANSRSIEKYASLLFNIYSEALSGSTVCRSDTIQQSFLAAFRAAQLFDESRGVRFMTYASKGIRTAVRRVFSSGLDVVPVGVVDGDDPTGEHADPPKWLLALLDVSDWQTEEIVDRIDRVNLYEEVVIALGSLSLRQHTVLDQHYRCGRSYAEIARDLGVCRERTRKLAEEGLELMRSRLRESRDAKMAACHGRISNSSSKSV